MRRHNYRSTIPPTSYADRMAQIADDEPRVRRDFSKLRPIKKPIRTIPDK